jgi:hypothetical protein
MKRFPFNEYRLSQAPASDLLADTAVFKPADLLRLGDDSRRKDFNENELDGR